MYFAGVHVRPKSLACETTLGVLTAVSEAQCPSIEHAYIRHLLLLQTVQGTFYGSMLLLQCYTRCKTINENVVSRVLVCNRITGADRGIM